MLVVVKVQTGSAGDRTVYGFLSLRFRSWSLAYNFDFSRIKLSVWLHTASYMSYKNAQSIAINSEDSNCNVYNVYRNVGQI
jgi:hypothetical protein